MPNYIRNVLIKGEQRFYPKRLMWISVSQRDGIDQWGWQMSKTDRKDPERHIQLGLGTVGPAVPGLVGLDGQAQQVVVELRAPQPCHLLKEGLETIFVAKMQKVAWGNFSGGKVLSYLHEWQGPGVVIYNLQILQVSTTKLSNNNNPFTRVN